MKLDIKKISLSPFSAASSVYFFGSAFNAVLGMLLVPVFTRYLTPVDYGIVATATVLIQVFTVIIGVNGPGLIGRSHFENNKNAQRNLVSACLLLAGMTSAALGLIFIFAGRLMEAVTKFPSSWAPVIVLITFSAVIKAVYLSIVQARREPKIYVILQTLSAVLDLAISLLLILAAGMDWRARILGALGSGIILAAVCFHGLSARLNLVRMVFDRDSLRSLFSYGVPLIPHIAGGLIMVSVAPLYLNHMAGLSYTGLFGVGLSVASPVAMAAGALNQAYWPALFARLSSAGLDKIRFARMLLRGAFCLFLLALLYGVAARWFVRFLVGPRFYGASDYAFWLTLACAMQGIYFIFANFVVFSKKTSFIAWRADFLGGIFNVVLCPVLIKLNGPIGAAQSTFLAFTVSTIGCFSASRKAHPMPWARAAYDKT